VLEPPKADLKSGRSEAMEEQMMATLSSIWDQRRIWSVSVSLLSCDACGSRDGCTSIVSKAGSGLLKYSYTKYTRRQDANTAMKPIRKMPMMAAAARQLIVLGSVLVEMLPFFLRLMLRFRAGEIGKMRTNRSVRMLMAAMV